MSFIKAVLSAIPQDKRIKTPDVVNFGNGDDITDPDALAFFMTQAKLTKTQGQPVMFPRASSLYNACMRMHVLACKSKITLHRQDENSPNETLVFGLGNAVHYMLQNTPSFFGSRRVGWWRCLACHTRLYFGQPPTNKCPKCGALPTAIFYEEHDIKPEAPYYCGGHVDLFLKSSNGTARPLEAKTMGEEEFYTLKAPLAMHEFQLCVYLFRLKHDPLFVKNVDTEHGYLLYLCKKTKVRQMPYKMWHVKLTPAIEQSIQHKLKIFSDGYLNYPKMLPPILPTCADFTSWQARKCECLELCRNRG